jgi:predicted membrane channel-forming protein YqfA (hemolysin III family)
MTRGSRTILGVFSIIVLIGLIVAAFANLIAPWPIWAQSLFYLGAGLVWLLPLKPLLVWMNKA